VLETLTSFITCNSVCRAKKNNTDYFTCSVDYSQSLGHYITPISEISLCLLTRFKHKTKKFNNFKLFHVTSIHAHS